MLIEIDYSMNSRKYKIVFCTPALYSAGGTERVVSVKANYFADVLGYDVTIIVTEGYNGNSFFPLSSKVKVINLDIDFEELWNISYSKKILLYLRKQLRYKKLLSEELLKIKPDITISTLRREINFLSQIQDGSCKVGELHLSRSNYRGMDDPSNVLKRLFSKWWKSDVVSEFQKLDRFIVLTESALLEWPELKNMRLIPDPLPITVKGRSLLDQKRVIAVGRYSYEKGYDILLKVWSIVEKNFKDWQLDVYAMGDPTPYVKLRDELSIDKRRCHLNSGLVDVEGEYLKSSILVQPSRTEGFGLVLIESMACGLPVVAFDCENGPRSIISDCEQGFLVPPLDVDMFSSRLMTLMENEDLRRRMGEKGFLKSQQYHINNIGQQWKKLFDEMMESYEI